MLALGWRLAPITLFHLLPLSFSALSWRELLSTSCRLNVASAAWIRWIRESINNLLPVASIGGDVASVRLAHLRGVASAQAAASVVVDTTVGVVTQLRFRFGGRDFVADSLNRRRLACGGASRVDRHRRFRRGDGDIRVAPASKHAGRLRLGSYVAWRPRTGEPCSRTRASAIDDAGRGYVPSPSALLRAGLLRLATWVTGAGEIWLVTYFLGRSLSAIDALILESLGNGIYAAAFIVPGAIGVLEGGFVVFGALFGLPADISLSISLSKRVRELLLGLPGLLVWQWTETQSLLRPTRLPPMRKRRIAALGSSIEL